MKIISKVRNFPVKYISQLLPVYMVVIFIFSIIPSLEGGLNSGFSTHVLVYSLLSILMVMYFKVGNMPYPWMKGVLLAGSFGFFMELIQFFIPYRKFELEDIIINYLSALIAVFPGYFIMKFLNINPSKD